MSENEYKWYIIQAYAGQEAKVQKVLEKQLAIKGMSDLVEEIFIPSEVVTKKKMGKERTVKLTYYPGYILVKMNLTPDLWHVIKDTPKVSGFVGGTQKDPLPLKEKELEAIRNQIDAGSRQAELNSTFQKGQSVRVVEGPFADFNGVVDEINNERNKVTVLVTIFGRTTPLELDFDKVNANE